MEHVDNTSGFVYLDIETNMSKTTIWLCCVNDVVFHTSEVLQEFLQGKHVVAHNGIAFDFYYLEKLWGIKIPEDKQHDTLILSRLANADREGGHSLEAWGEFLKCPKQDQPLDFDAPDMVYLEEYCRKDVIVLEQVHKHLLKEMQGFSDKSIQLEYEAARILAEQERYGWKIDVLKILELRAAFTDELQRINEEMQKAFPPIVHERISDKTGKRLKDEVEVFNPGSRQQIIRRLQKLGWEPSVRTEKGNFILDEEVLDGIIAQCGEAS